MIFIKDEAIILKSTPVSSDDLSVTVYLKNLGKENIYVKGGQILKNLYLPKLQPMNWIKGVFISYKEKLFIKEIDKNVNMAYPIAQDVSKLKTTYFILQVFDKYTLFPDERLFSLLKSFLYNVSTLEKNENLELLKVAFLIKYIALYGVLPSIDKCVKCRTQIDHENFSAFSFKEGGSICKTCKLDKKSDLTYNQLKILTKLLKNKFSKLKKEDIKMNPSLSEKLLLYLENH